MLQLHLFPSLIPFLLVTTPRISCRNFRNRGVTSPHSITLHSAVLTGTDMLLSTPSFPLRTEQSKTVAVEVSQFRLSDRRSVSDLVSASIRLGSSFV